MEIIFQQKSIPEGCDQIIRSFISNKSEEEYWIETYKEIFSKRILSKIDPRGYFSQYVLSHIDLEYKLVAIDHCQFCDYCFSIIEESRNTNINHDDRFNQSQNNCHNCNMVQPCLNCYYYGFEECNHYRSEKLEFVSWKQISGMFRNGIGFTSFSDYKKNNP